MNPKRTRLVLLSALGLVGAIFLVVFLAATSIVSQQSKKMVGLKLQSHTVDAQLANLAAAKKQVEQYAYFNDVAKTVLPSDKNQAQAVLDIFQMANESGIAIASITFPASTLGAPAAKPADNNAATAAPSTIISQATPVQGISGLYSIALTIMPQTDANTPADKQVTYPKFLDFLTKIEKNRRTAQITSVDIQPSGGSQVVNFVITVNIFIKP